MDEITHKLWKRSWWDGSVTGWCGQTFPPGHYRENWFGGGTTCPGCIAAWKARKR